MGKKPRVLLMGSRRAGKTSIFKTVFHKMSPHETLFLESTTMITRYDVSNSSFFQFSIWDFPCATEAEPAASDMESMLKGAAAIVYVVDAQDDLSESMPQLAKLVLKVQKHNPKILVHVFVHKHDGLSEDDKQEVYRSVSERLRSELQDESSSDFGVAYHLTSIYDYTVFEAVSRVVQNLVPHLSHLEGLLDALISKSRLDKAFLFDVVSKVYIATDSTPFDPQTYEVCSDMMDVVIDVSCIYGAGDDGDGQAYDTNSASVMRLTNGNVLFLREVSKYLALVCMMRQETADSLGLVNHNVDLFKSALKQLFEE